MLRDNTEPSCIVGMDLSSPDRTIRQGLQHRKKYFKADFKVTSGEYLILIHLPNLERSRKYHYMLSDEHALCDSVAFMIMNIQLCDGIVFVL